MNKRTLSRRTTLLCLLALPILTGLARQTRLRHASPGAETLSMTPAQPAATAQTGISNAYGRLPLSFEANRGQTNPEVQFLSRGSGYSLFLTSTEAVLVLRNADCGLRNREPATDSLDDLPQTPISSFELPHSAFGTPHSAFRTPHSLPRPPQTSVLRMKLVGANPKPQGSGLVELPGKANYFLGNDPKQWRTNIPTYGKVKYNSVYPGIDLVYYGRQQQLEYDLVLAPGADPNSIRMNFEGADKLKVDAEGNLILHTAAGELVQHIPTIYQELNGTKQTISGRYVLLAAESSGLSTEPARSTPQQVGFEVGGYNHGRTLVIDPVLVYSTYLVQNQETCLG